MLSSDQTVCNTLGHRGLSGSDITVEENEWMLFSDKIADRQVSPSVVLSVPLGELAEVQQKGRSWLRTRLYRTSKPNKVSPLAVKSLVGQTRSTLEDVGLDSSS